jgi:hypothetical protein
MEARMLLSTFTLDNQGNLFESTQTSPLKIDSNVASYAVSSNGTLYDRHTGDQMNEFQGGKLSSFDSSVLTFVLDSNGSVYDLHTDGTMHLFNPANSPATWTQVASSVVSLASADLGGSVWFANSTGLLFVTGDSRGTRQIAGGVTQLLTGQSGRAVYALETSGILYYGSDAIGGMGVVDTGVRQVATADLGGSVWYVKYTNACYVTGDAGGTRQIDTGAFNLMTAESGRTVYVLQANGSLYRGSDAIGGMGLVDTGVTQMATADLGGSVWYLKAGGTVMITGDAGGTRQIDTGANIVASGDDGLSVYVLGGQTLYRGSDAIGGMAKVDVLVQSFQISTPISPISINDWFSQNLPDLNVQTLVRQDLVGHGNLTRSDLLNGIFPQIESGGAVSTNQLTSLRTLAAAGTTLGETGDTSYLLGVTVNNDPADARYQGQNLPVLTGGTGAYVLTDLVNKWFLGLDHPTSQFTRLATGQTIGGPYSPVTGSLFSANGPSYFDVFQGNLGDCTLMASLAEVAARTSIINSMFTNVQANIWTVRFYRNGAPVYVTVDNQLPDGGAVFAHPAPNTGYFWVALAEKAYAQLNESGWLKTTAPGWNSYASLDNGNENTVITALSAITGRSAADFSLGSGNLASAMQQGKLIVLGTPSNEASSSIVPNHAYALVAYTSGILPYSLFNPWGINGGQAVKNGPYYPGLISANGAALAADFSYAVSTGSAESGATYPLPAPESIASSISGPSFLVPIEEAATGSSGEPAVMIGMAGVIRRSVGHSWAGRMNG